MARLDLFGSASGPERAENPGEGLEAILGKRVDVVTVNGRDNPYFRTQVLAQREQLYAA